jgi:phage terminase large subunit
MDLPKAQLAPPAFAFSALKLNLYTWQIETLAAVGKGMPTACLAPNGSGKSSTVLTALILWFLSEFQTGRAIVTSGSWAQLKSQLFDSLKRFQHHPLFRGWDFQESAIKTPQGGFAIGLSVDDAYKMEGHHRRDDSPVLIAIDEAKAIADPVFEAIGKCTPTFQIIVSSAGPAAGKLYRIFTSESAFWFRRRVTYRECPHLPEAQRLIDIELYPQGVNSTFYRNKWLSEFATDAGTALIPLDAIRECLAKPPEWQQGMISAGCDFAAGGGDSCVLAIASGNRIEIADSWKAYNPKKSAGRFTDLFRKHGLQSDQIAGDAGGLGVGFIYDLQENGYFIKEVHNGAAAENPEHYSSRGAEMWDQFGILVQNRRIILPKDEALIAELSNRKRDYDGKGRVAIESKRDMKSRGLSSPDLADAVIIACMTGWGGLPQNLNPKVHAQTLAAMEQINRRMERNRSPFAVEYVDWNRAW